MNPYKQRMFEAIADAVTWCQRTGWPTREDDLGTAEEVAGAAPSTDHFLGPLALRLGYPNEDAIHRAVLCRLVLQAKWISDPTAGHG